MNLKKANAVFTPAVPEVSEEANLRLSSPDITKDEASRFRRMVARVDDLSLDRPDLQFAAKESKPAHGSARGVRLGQDQVDREVSYQRLSTYPKVCFTQKNRADHNSRRLRLGGQQDHEEVHYQRRRNVLGQALDKVMELNSTSHGTFRAARLSSTACSKSQPRQRSSSP